MTDPKKLNPQEKIGILVKVAQSMNAAGDLSSILSNVLDEVIEAVGAERGFVVLQNVDSLEFISARGYEKSDIPDPNHQISTSIINHCLSENQAILTTNASSDLRFAENKSVMDLELKSILCAPITSAAGTKGAVYIENRLLEGVFGQDQLDILTSIASNAGTALDHAELVQSSHQTTQLELEMQSAAKLQEGLIATEKKDFQGLRYFGIWEPANEVAGDFYLVGETRGGLLYAAIADISGKGAAAALFMASVRSALLSNIENYRDPSQILTETNRNIAANNAEMMFASVFLALIEAETGKTTYSNGGHNPAFLIRDSGRIQKLDDFHGPVLGAMPDSIYKQRTMKLAEGVQLFMYTDGLLEIENNDGEFFGYPRLESVLRRSAASSPRQISKRLLRHVREFQGENAQIDDITMLTLFVPQDHSENSERFETNISPDFAGHKMGLEFAEHSLADFSVSASTRREVLTVLDELLSNIVKFSEIDVLEFQIAIALTLENSILELEVVDGGIQFNPFNKPKPDSQFRVEERRIGGLGLTLMNQLADKVSYARVDNKNVSKICWRI